MALPAEKRRYTVTEYLEREEKALDRHEFHDGEILAMSGGTYVHGQINSNVTRALGNRLGGTGCTVVGSDVRVRVGRDRHYVYPDQSVVCGSPAFDPADDKQTTILNPKVIFEVLSDSTEAYDRGDKFARYREVPSIIEYVLVSQREPMVETFRRGEDGTWRFFAAFAGWDAVARLPSIGIDLPLADVYAGIKFPDAGGPDVDAVDPLNERRGPDTPPDPAL
ncbi:MAG: hypothetical protein JWO31_3296 [Phycisphaerales bacterium]|nr:hypothetical protein [Phycisphaerales bacterium]